MYFTIFLDTPQLLLYPSIWLFRPRVDSHWGSIPIMLGTELPCWASLPKAEYTTVEPPWPPDSVCWAGLRAILPAIMIERIRVPPL
ncbi:hypothetical protein PILCRDRAFT_530421 [Piloderma croceum F 1598]|uniref:Uncharacterized protein n=1 Tax=Piloderma croceum (strain F 1598) TaxID=765440 RepID=A0A0C3FK85_PILCF|nr:hypothetical protein PILCRDRAFT_530421 [Piloderma croceum F 1598]